MEEVTIEVVIRKFDIATIGMIELSKKSKLSNGGGGLLTGRFDTHSFGGSMPPPLCAGGGGAAGHPRHQRVPPGRWVAALAGR